MSTTGQILTLYPQILETKCIIITGYKYCNNARALCLRCYLINFMPLNIDYSIFHGFSYRTIHPLNCSLCNKTLAIIEPLAICPPCFLTYKTFFGHLRINNISATRVNKILYSHHANQFLKLDIAES